LFGIAVAFLLAQLLLFDLHRPPSWDEAVYLSQVSPGVPATVFAPSRARGITFLVAPVALAGGSVAATRLWLAVASAAALGLAYAAWSKTIGGASAVAGGLFGSTWLALFYGSESMPNLWSGLLGVAACAFFVRRVSGSPRERSDLVAGALLLAGMALVRPPDALALAAALGAIAVVRGRLDRQFATALLAGFVAGSLPWFAEVSVRFGGPLEALRVAGQQSHVAVAGPLHTLAQHLALTDGPTLGPDAAGIAPAAIAWWAGLGALVVFGIRGARDGRSAVIAAMVSGAVLAATYVVAIGGLAPRFLIPAIALLVIPAAEGVRTVLRSRRIAASLVLGLALIASAAWQVSTATAIESAARADRDRYQRVGLALAVAAGGRPCAFGSTEGFPQIAYASGCEGQHLRSVDALALRPLTASTATASFVAAPAAIPPASGLGLEPVSAPVAEAVGWRLWALPG
jgi:hypothetical protein